MRASSRVEVRAAARLHLGFLDLNGGLGRRFGSIGLALDGPLTRLTLSRSETAQANGPDSERASSHLETLRVLFQRKGPYALTVHQAPPSHSGLGSGTTLSLAVAAAFRRLEGLRPDLRADVAALSRGERSGIGIGVFRAGGFVVD